MGASKALLLCFSVLLSETYAETGSSPPTKSLSTKSIVDVINEQTFQHHTGREASAVYSASDTNSNGSSAIIPLSFVPLGAPSSSSPLLQDGPEVVFGPQNASRAGKPAAAPVEQYEVYMVDGDPIVVSKPGSQAGYKEALAVPAAIVLVLVLAAAVGFLVVYRRRASRYHGLSEAELGQVHRNTQ